MSTWKKNTYKFTVLERDLDSFGHMNNATYLDYFEAARWQFITENGYGFNDIHKHKKGPIILEIKLEFKKELKLRHEVTIESQTQNYQGKIGDIIQEMKSEQGELLCRAYFKFGFFDMNTRKLIEPTPEWIKAIGGE